MKTLHHEDGMLLVGVNLRTNVELTLDAPRAFDTSQGAKTADRVGLWVDDPRAVATQLRARATRGT